MWTPKKGTEEEGTGGGAAPGGRDGSPTRGCGCQTHWVRVWVSNCTSGCTHTRTYNKPGRVECGFPPVGDPWGP
jgi:hypothetical protein